MCVCSLSNPACKAHALYCISSLACLAVPYFSTISRERPGVWGKKFTEKNVCFYSLYKFCHSKRIQRGIIIPLSRYTPYSCRNLMEFEMSRDIFLKSSNIKFNENPSSERRVVPCGRTDTRHS
jgi:hypothetical protein